MKAAKANAAAVSTQGSFEDALLEAQQSAAMLAVHFEAASLAAGKDKLDMFAAMGHEDLARTILRQLDVLLEVFMNTLRDKKGGA